MSGVYGSPEGTTHMDGNNGNYRYLKEVRSGVFLLWQNGRWTYPVKPRGSVKNMKELRYTGLPSDSWAKEKHADPRGFNQVPEQPRETDQLFHIWRTVTGYSGMKEVNKTVYVGQQYGKSFDEAVLRYIISVDEMLAANSGWYDSFYPEKHMARDDFMPSLVKDRADKYEVPYENEKATDKVSLRFCLQRAFMNGAVDHPCVVMKRLGITYKRGIPQSMGDQWWFLDCQNVPKTLPDYLTVMDSKLVEEFL